LAKKLFRVTVFSQKLARVHRRQTNGLDEGFIRTLMDLRRNPIAFKDDAD